MSRERDFTARLAGSVPSRKGVILGIGDDAAVVKNHGATSVLCTDPVVEGVHFEPSASGRSVGWKAVARNLSDLAAMGAEPDYVLVSLLVPDGCSARRRNDVMAGVVACAEVYGCAVVGGDTGTTPGPLTVTVTAVGHLRDRALRRGDAAVGHQLFVTGPLGGSIHGRHLQFEPRFDWGRRLARDPAVGGVMDVSDGLVLDLLTMLDASDVPGAILDASRVPVHADVSEDRGLRAALYDGEDHELLFSRDPGGRAPRGAHRIGQLVERRGVWLRDADDRLLRLPRGGWDPKV